MVTLKQKEEAFKKMVNFIQGEKTRTVFMDFVDYIQEALYRWADEKEYEDKKTYISCFQKSINKYIKIPGISWKACNSLGKFQGCIDGENSILLKITKSKFFVEIC